MLQVSEGVHCFAIQPLGDPGSGVICSCRGTALPGVRVCVLRSREGVLLAGRKLFSPHSGLGKGDCLSSWQAPAGRGCGAGLHLFLRLSQGEHALSSHILIKPVSCFPRLREAPHWLNCSAATALSSIQQTFLVQHHTWGCHVFLKGLFGVPNTGGVS